MHKRRRRGPPHAAATTMTDCAEEQEMEVEALLSILMDDMAVVTGSEAIAGATHAPCYQIVVSPLGDGEEEDPDGDESQRARLGLVFSHTPNYPEEPPLIKCRSLRGLFDAELVACKSMLDALAKESVGMPMIFDLAQAAKEWMRDRAGVVDVVEETPEQIQRRLEEEAEARLRAMRATGTPVTVDSYREWVEKFDAERALKRLKAGQGGSMDDDADAAGGERRMTGRRYFEERTAAQLEADEKAEGEEEEDDFDFGDSDFDDSDEDLIEFMKGGGDGDEDGEEDGEGGDGDDGGDE